MLRRWLASAPPAPSTTGNVFEPVPAGTAISGNMRKRSAGAMGGTTALAATGLAAGFALMMLARR